MKKSKILALLLVVVLAVTSVVGTTLAYLTDRDSEANVFTVGDVEIDLEEDFDQGATLIPGVDINKDVTITNTGKNDAWVWYTYAIPSVLDNDDASKNVVHINHAGANWLGYQTNESYWADGQTEATPEDKCWIVDYEVKKNVKVDDTDIEYNVYTVLYNGKLPVGETTTVGLTKVYMDPHVDIDPDGNWAWVENGVATDLGWNNSNGNPVIYVSAYAIQTEGFATVQEAYAAYNTQWGDNGSEWGTPATVTEVATADELTAALAEGGVVVLTADITMDGNNMVTVPAGVDATVNLNGHNITADFSAKTDGASAIFTVKKGATLTIEGEGNVHATAAPTLSYVSAIINNDAGNVVVNGGNYSMEYGTYNDGYLIPTIIDTNSNVGKATTTINGGTFTHTRNMFRNFAQPNRGENNATLIINGGTFSGEENDYAAIWNQKTSSNGVEGDGIVTVNGGTFNYVEVNNDFKTGVTIAEGVNLKVAVDE